MDETVLKMGRGHLTMGYFDNFDNDSVNKLKKKKRKKYRYIFHSY
jgi:hypothetical protein